MRRLLLLSSVLLVLGIPSAHAGQGLNLRWSNCFGDGGTFNRNFACNTNTGTNILVGSFELATDMPQVTGLESVFEFVVASATLPEWWSFRNAGTCRMASLSTNFTAPATAQNCVDWSDGQGLGGIAGYIVGAKGPSSVRILLEEAALDFAKDLSSGQEYFAFNVIINNAKTVGSGSCDGCSVPACLVYSFAKLTTGNENDYRTLGGGTNNTDSFFTTWQGPSPVPPGGKPCPWPTPTRKETWGAVKSLYR